MTDLDSLSPADKAIVVAALETGVFDEAVAAEKGWLYNYWYRLWVQKRSAPSKTASTTTTTTTSPTTTTTSPTTTTPPTTTTTSPTTTTPPTTTTTTSPTTTTPPTTTTTSPTTTASPGAVPSAPFVQKSNLVYVGAFRVPQGSSDQTTFNYGGTALAYNPANNSLFMTGHDQQQLTAEIRIPALANTSNVNNLATASILQSFRDPTEGKIESINRNDPNAKKIGGHLVYNGKLYVSAFAYYDGDGTQSASHFVRPLSLSTSGQVQGPFKVGSQYAGFVSGYMTTIPQEWRAHFGGPALTGNCCIAIAGIQSNGPAVSVFDPENVGRLSPVPATPVLGYPYGNILGPGETVTNSIYNMSTVIRGVVFPSGSRSVLFFGRIGIGRYCYGGGDECGDPADPYKGTHAYPYVYQVWAYDANDLLAVKNGSKLQHQVQPYAIWNFNLPFESNGTHFIGGVAYDEASRNLYVSQQCEDDNCAPIIHAFKINI